MLGGSDERLQILKVSRKGQKFRNTQCLMPGMNDDKYSKLAVRDERLDILQVRWKGWKIRDIQV